MSPVATPRPSRLDTRALVAIARARLVSAWLPLAALLPLAACDAAEPAAATADDTLDRFVREAGVEFERCGTLSFDDAAVCGENYAGAIACLRDGLDACLPRSLAVQRTTASGSTLTDHYFVLPVGDGCALETFVEDRFRPGCTRYVRRRCEAFSATPDRCSGVDPTGCDDPLPQVANDCPDPGE